MKRGLVIGKFMPVHLGHIALINFAASQCDEVIVSMSYTLRDPIDPELRFSWIEEIFKEHTKVKPACVPDDFDDTSLPWTQRTRLWAAFIRKTYPPVDVIFSSEEYGEPFASSLGIIHISFDQQRKQFPVSASLIREKPFHYWEYIPWIVRPYFVRKICFYGPESTGKSLAAMRMAERYKTEFVPEVARELITKNDFNADDIVRIAIAHYERIVEKVKTARKILCCDTDAITTQIYAQHYLGSVPPIVFELERKVHYDHYFLFDIDVPWVADGLRDLGNQREEMFGIFKDALLKRNIRYTLVSGSWEQREKIIIQTIDGILA